MTPKLTPETHRLSQGSRIMPFKSRKICQRCASLIKVAGWIEHDHHDQPEPIYLFLCLKCSNELIEPHPRLYRQFGHNEPLPGVMDICADCKHRVGSKCESPLAKFNGGTGMKYDIAEPARGFVNGPKYRGRFTVWPFPASACSGKEVKTI